LQETFAMTRAKQSAGILLYRFRDGEPEVLLVHPGGPFWAKKDAGAWSIPKGEIGDGEEALLAAQREFAEETGTALQGEFAPLQPVRQKGGKTIQAWAIEGDLDAAAVHSNLFSMEWPPKSGRQQEFPEIDRAQWFTIAAGRSRLNPGQAPLLDQLEAALISRRRWPFPSPR
jgi:predicted NUDIX family NTP pyrophosphohydrolase